jgi:hypothetical protein
MRQRGDDHAVIVASLVATCPLAEAMARRHGASRGATLGVGRRSRPGAWREQAMWWVYVLVLIAVIAVLFVVLKRRGAGAGDPDYQPDDPRRSTQQLGGPPGQFGPGGT